MEPIKIQQLAQHLFWDIDINKIDIQQNKTTIIERVFTRGDISDFKIILQFYGIEIIKKEIIKAGFLDKKTLNWASSYLKIPKSKFKCYTKIQSKEVHWNF